MVVVAVMCVLRIKLVSFEFWSVGFIFYEY